MKRTECRKFIDSFGLNIETDPSRVGKKNVYFVHIGSTPSHSSVQIHISRHHLDKELNLEPSKLHLYKLTKNIAVEIMTHISSTLRHLSVIFEKSILDSYPKLVDTNPAGTLDS